LAAVLPAVLYLVLLPRFGRLQYNDYYGIIPQVLEGTHFTSNPLRWLRVKSNEHTVVLPALLYAANATAIRGDNRGLAAFGIALLAATAAMIAAWRPGGGTPLAAFGAGALVMTPAAAHSVVLGFSGTIWFLSSALAVAAMALLLRDATQPSTCRLIAVVATATLGALAYSTNLALWPALVAGALLLRLPRRHVTAIAGAGMVVFLAAALAYVRPVQHPPPDIIHPARTAGFLLAALGSALAEPLWAAVALGAAGLVAAAVVATPSLRSGRKTAGALAPWLMLQIFAAGNLAATAVARGALGGARSSRYMSVAALFWIGLVAGALALSAPRPRLRRAAVTLGVLLVVASWVRGVPVLRDYLARAARQEPASLALLAGVPDDEALAAITPSPHEALALRPFLVARGQVPFDRLRPLEAVRAWAGDIAADDAPLTLAATACRSFDSTLRLEGRWPAAAPAPGGPLRLLRDGAPAGVLGETDCQVLPRPPAGSTHERCFLAYVAAEADSVLVATPLLAPAAIGPFRLAIERPLWCDAVSGPAAAGAATPQ
jgi:hypothetical protein